MNSQGWSSFYRLNNELSGLNLFLPLKQLALRAGALFTAWTINSWDWSLRARALVTAWTMNSQDWSSCYRLYNELTGLRSSCWLNNELKGLELLLLLEQWTHRDGSLVTAWTMNSQDWSSCYRLNNEISGLELLLPLKQWLSGLDSRRLSSCYRLNNELSGLKLL